MDVDQYKTNKRAEIKLDWIERVKRDRWMDEIIFGFADIFPSESNEAGTSSFRNYKCADVLEAVGLQIPPK